MSLPPLLVVDDERNMRLSLETVMADEGYAVRAVESAEEGLRLLEDQPFFMVITDARLGGISGYEFLGRIKEAFDEEPDLANLLLAPYFKNAIDNTQKAWRKVVATAVTNGIPVPAFSSALAYYDGYRNERLPANLLQAQRDYFGAHTYERVDKPRGEFFHTNWTGRGGDTAATTYTA